MSPPTRCPVRTRFLLFLGACLSASSVASLRAEDIILSTPVRDLKIVQGTLPPGDPSRPAMPTTASWGQQARAEEIPYAVLDGPGEAYVDAGWPTGRPELRRTSWPLRPLGHVYPDDTLSIRVPAAAGGEVRGRLIVPAEKGMAIVSFAIPIRPSKADDRRRFGIAKLSHFELLLHQGDVGGPWIRRQIREALALVGESDGQDVAEFGGGGGWSMNRATTMEDTLSLFGGGRAIGENLQLDRPLPLGRPGGDAGAVVERGASKGSVKLESLTGITVAEMDWRAKLAGRHPALDPLAKAIPADQHALFLRGPAAAKGLVDLLNEKAMPLLGLAGLAGEILPVQRRFERQLGVTLDELAAFQARVSGAPSIRSLALTGSDPYFATGTDLALIFEVADPSALKDFLREKLEKACRDVGPDLHVVEQPRDGGQVLVARSADRSLSAYLTTWDGLVLLSNSSRQVQQIERALAGKLPRLLDAPEYAFFRDRYPLGQADESGLLVLSDATIRRWCGPRWRIGSSRRVRAAARLAAMQAQHLEAIGAGRVQDQSASLTPPASAQPIELGRLTLTRAGVLSEAYGTLSNPTPIAELSLDEVTPDEAAAYALWRDGYQQNWRRYFDPIAVRIGAGPDRSVSADLTVTPLIASTEYKPFIELSGASKIAQGDGDPHPESILHVIAAIDANAAMVQQSGNDLSRLTQIPAQLATGWVGSSISVYLDEDPIWKQAIVQANPQDFLLKNLERLPIGLHVASKDGTRLALFLAGVRSFLDQSSPGMLSYETRKHGEHTYVRVGQKEAGGPAGQLAIYYAATPRALVVSPSETVIRRFFDRLDGHKPGAPAASNPPAPKLAWLGQSLGLTVSRDAFLVLSATANQGAEESLRRQAWTNLPILNEYHRLFPDRDPVALHEALWGTRIVCPGGGNFVWNEGWKTMESTAFGCPAAPRPGPGRGLTGPLDEVEGIRFGVSFEDQGLRAGAAVDFKKAP